MENRKVYNLSERDFIKWVEKEAERDLKTLTKEEFDEFQRVLKLGDLLAQGDRTPSVYEEWARLRRKMRLKNGREKKKNRRNTKPSAISRSKEIIV